MNTTVFKRAALLTSAVACLALTGCLVPEKFNASASFKPDGSYRYQFDGTVVNALVLMAKREGKYTDQDKAKMQAEIEREAQRPGVKKLKALDDTRYELVFDGELKPGKGRNGNAYEVFHVSDKDWKTRRVLSVSGPQMRPKDQQMMDELGIAPKGKISIVLPDGAKVLSHNATGTPGLLGKAYTWSVGGIKDRPSIEFQLP